MASLGKLVALQAAWDRFVATDRWLASMEDKRREALTSVARLRTAPSGHHLYRIGDQPDGFHALVEGLVRLVSYPVIGEELVAGVMGTGWLGQVSLIDGEARRHDAIASGPVTYATVSIADWANLVRGDPYFLGDIARLGCLHIRRQMDEIDALMTCGAKGRIGRTLLMLATTAQGGEPMRVPLGQNTLASLAGVSRQRTNILLRELEADGVIRTGYSYVDVIDPVAVASVSLRGLA